MLAQQTIDQLHQMRLLGMAAGFKDQLDKPDFNDLCFEERFGLLVDQEWTHRHNKRMARLLQQAKLRLPASMENIDYRRQRGLDRALLASLSTCQWITSHHNAIVTGPTGVGKSFIICALANAACRHDFSVRYYRVPRLLQELALARGDGSYQRLLSQLAKTDLVVLDDWGLAPFSEINGRDLLEVLDDRYRLRSTAIASQPPIEDWHKLFPNPTVADAIMDRLVHNAHKMPMLGDSMRKLEATLDQAGQSNA